MAAPQSDGLYTDTDRYFDHWLLLNEIQNIPDAYEDRVLNASVADRAQTYLFFGDHAIWAWAWAIACGNGADRGRIVVINGTDDRFVADSFAAFVDQYVLDFEPLW